MKSACAVTDDMRLGAHEMPGGWIRLLALRTGAERWRTRAADEDVLALAFSPDGKTLASGGGFVESSIRLWDVGTGKEIGRLEGHQSCVFCLLFDADGKVLISA